jgi:hypothetical protein
MIGQLPPAFEANQKILEPDLMDILVSKAPKSHRELMVDQGFNPQTATTDEFVEICERARMPSEAIGQDATTTTPPKMSVCQETRL